jgi:BRCT domain type II-containing protein
MATRSPVHSRVVTQPSTEIDYVILGEGDRPSKFVAIRKHSLSTLNTPEDEFPDLLATTKGPDGKDGKLDEKTRRRRARGFFSGLARASDCCFSVRYVLAPHQRKITTTSPFDM